MSYRKLIATCFLLILCAFSCGRQISLEQKIGQMLMIGFNGTKLNANDTIVKNILSQQVGGVILYEKDSKTKGLVNIADPAQLKKLTTQLQGYAAIAAKRNHNKIIPLLIGIDYEGGKIPNLVAAKGFPTIITAAEIGKGDTDQARRYANTMAETLQKAGVNLDFAPVVDLNINPKNPIIGKYERSYSADPKQVTKFARIFSDAFYDHRILCTYKHFPGHGSSTADTHVGFADVTKTWSKIELDPYKDLLNTPKSCQLVMVAHVINKKLDRAGYPASLSYPITTELLRQQLKFKGVIITDDLQMAAISDNYDIPTRLKLAINAGADILIFGNQLVATPEGVKEVIAMIVKEVNLGHISRQRIEDSYQRIMQLKAFLQTPAD